METIKNGNRYMGSNKLIEDKMKFDFERILIVGCGGAGKSTLAVEMGNKFRLPVVHLDKLYWLPNWETRRPEEFDKLLEEQLKKNKWIIDGNYDRTFALRLKYADLCIFLDYDTPLCIQSVQERVEKYRGTSRPDMTDGCEEQADEEFVEWILGYRTNVRPGVLERLQNSDVPYMIFTTRQETANWLGKF